MNPASLLRSVTAVVAVVGLLLLANLCFYTVTEQEQVILTQFGKTVGEPKRDAVWGSVNGNGIFSWNRVR